MGAFFSCKWGKVITIYCWCQIVVSRFYENLCAQAQSIELSRTSETLQRWQNSSAAYVQLFLLLHKRKPSCRKNRNDTEIWFVYLLDYDSWCDLEKSNTSPFWMIFYWSCLAFGIQVQSTRTRWLFPGFTNCSTVIEKGEWNLWWKTSKEPLIGIWIFED